MMWFLIPVLYAVVVLYACGHTEKLPDAQDFNHSVHHADLIDNLERFGFTYKKPLQLTQLLDSLDYYQKSNDIQSVIRINIDLAETPGHQVIIT